jgi:3-oxoacyl-(acyl-carrier-protein) synthase
MSRRVVITGIGLVTPIGIGKDTVWDNVLQGNSGIDWITRFQTEGYPLAFGGEVRGFNADTYMSKRLAKKLDTFTQYAIAASSLAIKDSALDLEIVDKTKVGVYVGTCFAGMDFADQQLRVLHNSQGTHFLSPFQATAWFPAAPQGQITILFGLQGQSKTILCDRASSLANIGYAARTIASGINDVVIAGGTEALITPYAFTACATEGILADTSDKTPSTAYRPFDVSRTGIVPGEGAAMLVLESLDSALSRNASIYAEVTGFSLMTDPVFPNEPTTGSGLARAMSQCISNAGIKTDAISAIFAEATGTMVGDRTEAEAIHQVFGSMATKIPVTAPKSWTGHLYGASGALDTCLGALAIMHSTIPPLSNCERPDPACALNINGGPISSRVNSILINNRGSGGVNASLLLSKMCCC